MDHSLDRPVAGVGVDGRARQRSSALDLLREPRRGHRGEPAALAEPDEIDAAAEVVDGDDQTRPGNCRCRSLSSCRSVADFQSVSTRWPTPFSTNRFDEAV